ncbi:multidrug resistance stp domain protein [Mycobacterium ulcerans str. Harvey]|uniref:Multidrug resistance stp domain protein n=1 Tax=Mycobacterium ulcerans str. Harvey TaxID=1299332 RepID=A0ABN0R2Q5_MYCUL|nr:multidrug resistance stp domain protein [Mycobacterium ulcerans str. Harvey]
MMDLTLFRDSSYALSIGTICTVFFAVYGMLLLTTQFLHNVRATPRAPALLISRLVSWVDDLWCRAIGAGV